MGQVEAELVEGFFDEPNQKSPSAIGRAKPRSDWAGVIKPVGDRRAVVVNLKALAVLQQTRNERKFVQRIEVSKAHG